ncbi:hypothetical protein CEXT_93991 [Caerostris extrusa]|uniref:Uncharacterized protein n=1 Tax=Caerostris extrusa TaxID=172846 RepID=A0AAV4QA32_CAEEX|nr:hypothetical protein CEXT_93991 [Caerostris extrusa]
MPGKINVSLCRTCTENMQQTACTHSNEERSLIGTWVSESAFINVANITPYNSALPNKNRRKMYKAAVKEICEIISDPTKGDSAKRPSTTGSGSTDSAKRPSTAGRGSTNSSKRSSTSDSGSTDNAKPIQRKSVHSVITLETAMKNLTRLVDQHPRYDGRVFKGRHQQPRYDDVYRHPFYKENKRVAFGNCTPSFRRNLFPNHNVKRYFHGKALLLPGHSKKGFTLGDGTLSASVDNDAWWKRTLTSLLLQKKVETVFLVYSETKTSLV